MSAAAPSGPPPIPSHRGPVPGPVAPAVPVIAAVVGGAVCVVVGVLVLAWPGVTLTLASLLFGVQLVLVGATRVGLGAFATSLETWVRPVYVVSGLLVAIVGVVCLRHPVLSVPVLIVTVAIGWLADGVSLVVAGVQVGSGRASMVAAGGLSVAAALVMLIYPISTTAVLLTVGGWSLIAMGLVSMVGLPWALRELRRGSPRTA